MTIYDICGVQPMTGPTGLIFVLRSSYISPNQLRKGAMCSLSNEECKELVSLLRGYQEFVIKRELDQRVETIIEKLLPYANQCSEEPSGRETYEEYDPQF